MAISLSHMTVQLSSPVSCNPAVLRRSAFEAIPFTRVTPYDLRTSLPLPAIDKAFYAPFALLCYIAVRS
jgi:hypothetical protein